MSSNGAAVFEYAYQHMNVVTYPVLIGLVWRASAWVNKAAETAHKAVDQINTLAENHFPHMQASLAKQDGHLESIDTSLKTLVDTSSLRTHFMTAQKSIRKRRK
jgi:hypothetical protein